MNMATIRLFHFYIGMFIAPSVLFFAMTGALQLFSLHEAHGTYTPPAIIEKLSSVHKDQVFALGHHRPDDGSAVAPAAKPAPDDEDHSANISTLLLKAFFEIIAFGMAISTGLGLWIGLAHPVYKRTAWMPMAIGSVVPVGLLLV